MSLTHIWFGWSAENSRFSRFFFVYCCLCLSCFLASTRPLAYIFALFTLLFTVTQNLRRSLAFGNPHTFLLRSGNDHDSKYAVPLLSQIDIKGRNIPGDKAYEAKAIRAYIDSQDLAYTIPLKGDINDPWAVDWHTYKERHLVECRSSNGFAGYFHAMTNSIFRLLRLFKLSLLPFCWSSTSPYRFSNKA